MLSWKNHQISEKVLLFISIIHIIGSAACTALKTGSVTPSTNLSPTASQVIETKTTMELSPSVATSATTQHPPRATPQPDIIESVLTISLDPLLPEVFKNGVTITSDYIVLSQKGNTKFSLTFGNKNVISNWIYALAGPFPTIEDEISLEVLKGFWFENKPAPFTKLILDESTMAAMLSIWGLPRGDVKVVASKDIIDYCWSQDDTWTIIPFEAIQPRFKVIALDGESPLHKDFDETEYALSVPISLFSEVSGEGLDIVQVLRSMVPLTNRNPSKLATVILTGVTAMARATASEMEELGVTRPADIIGATLVEADILHINNEVPFFDECPTPVARLSGKMNFCSKDEYLELLKVIGTDVVELTGDHLQDFGQEALKHTLDIYDTLGWSYYGGGMNIEDARKPITLEVNGTKLAFLGCNGKGNYFGRASETEGGAYVCEMDYMVEAVKQLKEEGYLPIVTFQHMEYFQWQAQSLLVHDFRLMRDAGAVIVSGSQAHQPHNIEVTNTSVIHYGLGNLFFDQFGLLPFTDTAFVDRHIFYDGKYLGVELLSIQFFDYSQPRWMDDAARRNLLERLFYESGWKE